MKKYLLILGLISGCTCKPYFDYSDKERIQALKMGLRYRNIVDSLSGLQEEHTIDYKILSQILHLEDTIEEYHRVYCSPHCDVIMGFYSYDEPK